MSVGKIYAVMFIVVSLSQMLKFEDWPKTRKSKYLKKESWLVF